MLVYIFVIRMLTILCSQPNLRLTSEHSDIRTSYAREHEIKN